MRSLARACLDALIAYGQIYMYVPDQRIDEPGPGHPERLCADGPLTETERALSRQLEGRGGRIRNVRKQR
ncbi:DUF6059 family protein [Streptomyces sp. NPDC056486]|uniref:DUF6059 family protein n=1 Tax=Streptomyces sp. NPDC056486 TaxID=3345835 RepID=UPI0036892559